MLTTVTHIQLTSHIAPTVNSIAYSILSLILC